MLISKRVQLGLLTLSLPILGLLVASSSQASIAPSTPNAAELQLQIEKLGVLASVLYVGGHPDDENTALLAYLSSGRLARTAYLSITRGDGGQNLIGTELGAELGVIRTQELLAARSQDGAEQFFTRAIDFGYSKSVEETLDIWGREQVLADVVRVVRGFRPDVIVTRFPGDGRGRHGHHTASAVLASEAFAAAADPSRFPEQLKAPENLSTWQSTRLLWDASPFFGGGQGPSEDLEVDLGDYNPLLGKSYTEIAALSRTMHKSQGFGSAGSRGSRVNRLEHRLGDEALTDLFEGIDTSWTRLPGAEQVGKVLRQAAADFTATEPSTIVPALLQADRLLDGLSADPWVDHKRSQIRNALRAASGLWLEVTADRDQGAAGEDVTLRVRAINRSDVLVEIESVDLPFEDSRRTVGESLAKNQPWSLDVNATVPATQALTPPYWLETAAEGALYRVEDPRKIGQPEHHPTLARFVVKVANRLVEYEVPLLYRRSDRVEGEVYSVFQVVPRISVELAEPVLVFGDDSARSVTVNLQHTGGDEAQTLIGKVRLRLPAGWSAEPQLAAFELTAGASQQQSFLVSPPRDSSVGTLIAAATVDGLEGDFSSTVRAIEYRHIPKQTLLPPAQSRIVRMQLERSGERIGYVMGAGDEVPAALRQVGYEVSLLTDSDLASGDLEDFDAVVVGVRAYNSRPSVKQHNQRLLDYVEAGGTLVVQYNTAPRRGPGLDGIGPYPFRVSRDRVSVEDAPVTLLDPAHSLLTQPNRITLEDFDGWVQERGLYFPNQWDDRYQTVLSSHDPGEPDREGGLIYAHYGKGVYIYTGYSFFRELPAGVPGAYRLFVNMISARQ